jgi:hypothetical protein
MQAIEPLGLGETDIFLAHGRFRTSAAGRDHLPVAKMSSFAAELSLCD